MRPSHRLDLIVLPAAVDARPNPEAFARLTAGWAALGALELRLGSLRAGPEAHRLIEGGFAALRLDSPAQPALYANEQGGFRVPCAACGSPMAGPFGAAFSAWRSGGPAEFACPSCHAAHDLRRVEGRPPIGVALGAVIFMDVGGLALTEAATDALAGCVGPAFRTVLRRAS